MFKFLTISCCLKYLNNINDVKCSLQRSKIFNKKRLRYFSQSQNKTKLIDEVKEDKYVPFLERIEARRNEARRSIVVQVQSSQSFKELHSYCSSIGSVTQMFHYSVGVEPQHFIIVEFSKESDVTNLLSNSSYADENLAIPTQSHFLWFKATNRKMAKLKQSKSFKLSLENGTHIPKESEITDTLRKCSSISDQMRTLYNLTKLNDLGTRLRFLTALQIESTVFGLFPQVTAYPFGSSVNGYGKLGCDLDLVLRLVNKKDIDESRLIFHSKAGSGSERTMHQRHMEVISDLIYLFLPGCSQVRRILQARIPIIKYHQQLTGVECDLSMSNMTGIHMSDFLFMMGEIDDRVRPLVFTIRKWANAVGLTNSSPGKWITNFSLTLLVLAFLQKPLNASILPPLNTLVSLAGPKDKYYTEEGINCTFLRDLNKYKTKSTNQDSLETLLKKFFAYYSQFDFSTKAVCLNGAVSITKPDFHPMYIVNPIERGLNVSRNVSIEEVEHFKAAVQNAAWILESIEEQKSNKWGILSLVENNVKSNIFVPIRQTRLMEVKNLFAEEEMFTLDKQEDIEYKNPDIKKQVNQIQKEAKANLKNIENNIKNQR